MRARTLAVAIGTLTTLLSVAPGARATQPTCTYDPSFGGIATVEMDGDTFTRVFVDSGGEIKAFFDEGVVDCEIATIENTVNVSVYGSPGNDVVVITQSGPGGPFPSDISHYVNGGTGGANELRLIGTSGPDVFRFGIDADLRPAVDLHEDGGPLRVVTFNVQSATARMLAGSDTVTGRPGDGFDGPWPLPLDVFGNRSADELTGSPGANEIDGGAGDDRLKGLGGPDDLFGRAGNDDLNGGPGNDDCSGGPGDDRLRGCEN